MITKSINFEEFLAKVKKENYLFLIFKIQEENEK